MGNAVTCSLVDVVGTVTVTQTDGQILEFVQPVFASQVKKLHPGNWLVHYVSVQDSASGKHHGKMSMLQGSEELVPGQIYFLLPIPSNFRKQIFEPEYPKQRSGSSKTISGPACLPPLPPVPKSKQQLALADISKGRIFRQEPSPVFSIPDSTPALPPQQPVQQQHVQQQSPQQQQQPNRSKKHNKIHVVDWRPTLMTIEEVY
ncbi:unnamed protein product [Calypogeia fissa]